MTQADLTDLLLTVLTRETAHSRSHWRRVVGPVRIYPRSTHPHCNWMIEPSGSVNDVETVQETLDRLRLQHPHIG